MANAMMMLMMQPMVDQSELVCIVFFATSTMVANWSDDGLYSLCLLPSLTCLPLPSSTVYLLCLGTHLASTGLASPFPNARCQPLLHPHDPRCSLLLTFQRALST
jgi:hypothetical protein